MKTAKPPLSQTRERPARRRHDRPGDHGDQTSVNSRDASHRDPDDVIQVGATEYHLPDAGARPYAVPSGAGPARRGTEGIGQRHGSPWLQESDIRARRSGHSQRR